MTKDEIVAASIEDKPEEPPRRGGFASVFISVGGGWIADWIKKDGEDKLVWLPRSFISAPTWELEGIVFEWVQEQVKGDYDLFADFAVRLHVGVGGYTTTIQFFGKYLEQHKLGAWALALLEVVNE